VARAVRAALRGCLVVAEYTLLIVCGALGHSCTARRLACVASAGAVPRAGVVAAVLAGTQVDAVGEHGVERKWFIEGWGCGEGRGGEDGEGEQREVHGGRWVGLSESV
jgi:hypothetical protein